MASDTADACTSTLAHETKTTTHRDDAPTSHQYETVMRDSHAFFQRRDLASYDEAPLYFAWERLYKAANAAVRVDWLDESLGEFLQRKHARVSPRRGLPPASLSLSASTARQRQRESARSSAFLRASLSSSRLHDPYTRSSSRVAKQHALYKDKRNRIKKMSKRTRAILEKIERELRSGEFTLTSPSKSARLKRAAATNESSFMRPPVGRSSVHPMPSTMRQLHRRASLKEDELLDDSSILRSSSLASAADPVRVAAFLESSLARDEPLLEFDRLSPIKRHSAIGGGGVREAAGKARTGWRDDVPGDSRMDKAVDTTHDSSFSDDDDSDAFTTRSVNGGYREQAAKTPRSEMQAHRGALRMAIKSEEDSSDLDDHSRSRPLDVAELSRRESETALYPDGISSFKDPVHPATNDIIHRRASHFNDSANNGPYPDRRLSRGVDPKSRELMSVSQSQPQHRDRSRKASSIAVDGRGADNEDEEEEEEDRLNKGQADVGAPLQSANRRLSRSGGPKSRQTMSVPQQQRRVAGGGRDVEYEDEGGFGVEQDVVGADWTSAARRLSRSLGPRTRQSQSQLQQQCRETSRRQTTAADDGGGRRNEYAYEDGLSVESGEFGLASQSVDRRSSQSVGPQRRQSIAMSQQAEQQRSGASRKPTMRTGAGRGDELEAGNGSEVVQGDVGGAPQSAHRRLTRSVGHQSASVSRLDGVESSHEVSMAAGSARNDQFDGENGFGVQQGGVGTATQTRGRRTSQPVGPQTQQQAQRVDPSKRKPSKVAGGGRSDEDEDGDGFGIYQGTDGAASQSAGSRLSRSVGPHSRLSMSAPQVHRGDDLLKPRMVARSGRGDEYADENEDEFDFDQEDARGASQETSRRSVNPQNWSSLSVPQRSHSQTWAGQQQQHKAASVSRGSGVVPVGDNEEHKDGSEEEHSDEGVESSFASRRYSRPVGLQGHQSISMTQEQHLQPQPKQQRGNTSRNQSMLTGGGRRGMVEDTDDFEVSQGDSQPATRRLSRSVRPQSRSSMAVSQQAEQQRVDAIRKLSMAAEAGRGDEHEYDHEIGVGIDRRGSGALSQSVNRRLSWSGGEQSRQSLSASLPRGGPPRKQTMAANATRDDEYEDGNGDFGTESQSAGHGLSQSTDRQSRQSMSTSNLQRVDASRKQSMGLEANHDGAYSDENEDEDAFVNEQDEVRAPSQVINRGPSRSGNPQNRQPLSVTQQSKSQFQSLQKLTDAAQKLSIVTFGDNEEQQNDVGVEQSDVGAESPSEDRRASRFVVPQGRQSMSASQRQRGDTARNQIVVTGSGRSREFEDADDFGVDQGDASNDSPSASRRLSRSARPQRRQSTVVTRQAEQQRVGALQRMSIAAGARRGYENEDEVGFGVDRGASSQSVDRRVSRSAGPHSRKAMSTPEQQRMESPRRQSMVTGGVRGDMNGFEEEQYDFAANLQSGGHRLSQSTGHQTRQSMSKSNLQRVDASQKQWIGPEAAQCEADKDENEDENSFGVDQGDIGAPFESADRRESQFVGRPSRQSMSVPQLSRVHHGDASEKPSIATRSSRVGEYEGEHEGEFDTEQEDVRGASQATNRGSSWSVNPQNWQSLSVPQRSQSQSQQKRVEVVRKQSMISGRGDGDDNYEDEDGFGGDHGRGESAAQYADRRLSRSMGRQSRQLMSVAQVQHTERPRVDPSWNQSVMPGGEGRVDDYEDEEDVGQGDCGGVSLSRDRRLSRSAGPQILPSMSREGESEVVSVLRKDGRTGGRNGSSPVRVTAQAMKKLFTGYPAENSDESGDQRDIQLGDSGSGMNCVGQVDTGHDHATRSDHQHRRTTVAMVERDSVDSSRAQFRSMPQLAKLLEAVDEAVGRSDGRVRAELHSRCESRQEDPEPMQGPSTQDGHEPLPRHPQHQHESSASHASLSGHAVRQLYHDTSQDNGGTDSTAEAADEESDPHAIAALYRDSLHGHHADLRSESRLLGRPTSQTVNKQPLTPVRGRALSNHNLLTTLDEADEEEDDSDDGEGIADGVTVELSRMSRDHDYLPTSPQPEKRVSRSHRQSARSAIARDDLDRDQASNGEEGTDEARQPEDLYVAVPSRLTSRVSRTSDQAQHAIDWVVARKQNRPERRNHGNHQDTSTDRSGEHLADELRVSHRESRSDRAYHSEKHADSDGIRDRRERNTRASGDAIIDEEESWDDDDGAALGTFSRRRRPSRAVDSQTRQSGSHSGTTTGVRIAAPTQIEGEEDLEQNEDTHAVAVSHRRTARVADHRRRKSRANEQHDDSMAEARSDTAVLFAEGISSFDREQREPETGRRRRTRSENRQWRREMSNDMLDADEQARKDTAETRESRPHRSSRAAVLQDEEYRDRGDYTVQDDPNTRARPMRTGRPGDVPLTRLNGTASRAKNAERSSRLQAFDEIDGGENRDDGTAQQRTATSTEDDGLDGKDTGRHSITTRATPRTTSEVYVEGIASFADETRDRKSIPQRSRALSKAGRPSGDHDTHHSMNRREQQHDHQSSSRSAAHETQEERPRHRHRRSSERGDRDTMATLFQEGVASYVDETSTDGQPLAGVSLGGGQRRSGLESRRADVDEELDDESEDHEGGVTDGRSHSMHRGRPGERHEHSHQRTRSRRAPRETELERHRFHDSEHARVEQQGLTSSRTGRRSQPLGKDDLQQNEPTRESATRVLKTVDWATRAQSRASNQVDQDAHTHRSIRLSSAVNVRVHPVRMEERATRRSYDSNQVEADRAAVSHDHQLPPPPHPTMTGRTGRDYQKFRDASTHGEIVWPPGMEDEAKRVPTYRAKHGHPLVPPGMDHLVSDEQLVEYWTWLHWYSCWQLYYLETSSSHKKKKKKTRATPLATDTKLTRGVAANWYISLSDSKLR